MRVKIKWSKNVVCLGRVSLYNVYMTTSYLANTSCTRYTLHITYTTNGQNVNFFIVLF